MLNNMPFSEYHLINRAVDLMCEGKRIHRVQRKSRELTALVMSFFWWD